MAFKYLWKYFMVFLLSILILPKYSSALTLAPVTIQGTRFYSSGKPYFPSTHFLMFPISTHVYFSEAVSDAERQQMLNDIKFNGYNSIYIYTLNQGDYGGRSVSPYVNNSIGGSFDKNKISKWRSELENMINDGIRPILWLAADDSGGIASISIAEFKRYTDKMVDAFDDLPIMWVLGLEVDEYWSKSKSDELGSYLQSVANNPVGIHQLKGRTDYMTSAWVDFGVYQYGFGGDWSSVYDNALQKKDAIGNKPFIFGEYHVGQSTQAQEEGLAAAFTGLAGLGNGAPGGLDEFMATLPDNMTPSRSGNILRLTGSNVNAIADMDNLNFYIESEDTTSPTVPTNLSATAVSSSQIDLTWQASSDPESGINTYNIYRNNFKVGQSITTSFSDKGLNEGTTYTYEVSAINGAGLESAKSTPVSAKTLADTTPPTIKSVSANGDSTKVTVVFSEPVEQVSAENVSNYQISNGITVSGASLGADLKTVTLNTSAHSEGITYTLTVNNIKDRASTPNVIAANTQSTYNFVAQLVISNLTVASGKNYEVVQEGLDNGDLVYIDRSFTYSNVPASVQGETYIKTANNDKGSSGASFLTFDVNQDVKVVVAHDNRITTKPSWLSSFTDIGDDIVTNDTTLSCFTKDFPAGKVTLGGNEGGGRSMYTVVILGQGSGSTPSDTTPPAPPTGVKVIP